MRYVQDLSLAEMALVTGKSKNTMAVQAHRGLAKLKQLYAAASVGVGGSSDHFYDGRRN